MTDLLFLGIRSRVTAYRKQPTALALEMLYVFLMLGVIMAATGFQSAAAMRSSVSTFLVWLLFGVITMSGVEWVSGEISGGRLERLLTGPRSHLEVILPEILASALVGFLRIFVAFAILALSFRLAFPAPLVTVAILASLFLFLVAIAVILAGVSLLSDTIRHAFSLLQVSLLAMMLFAHQIPATIAQWAATIPLLGALYVFSGTIDADSNLVLRIAFFSLVSAIAAIATFVFCDSRALRDGRFISRF